MAARRTSRMSGQAGGQASRHARRGIINLTTAAAPHEDADAELMHVTDDDDADVTSSEQPVSTRGRNSVSSRSDGPLDLAV